MACAITVAWLHAAAEPSGTAFAAANAARSAAACARCRPITAEPTYTAPTVSATSTAIVATPTNVAEPSSPRAGLHGGHRPRRDSDARQQHRPRAVARAGPAGPPG